MRRGITLGITPGQVELVLNWTDPPPSKKGVVTQGPGPRNNWLVHILPLVPQVGRWAEVARSWAPGPLSAIAASFSRPKSRWAALGCWEATTRTFEDEGYHSLFLRYLGPTEPAA